ncbi:MAG: type II CRISPR RNA-guided endonuclease Cas9 [Balneola sp.]|nr:type II CRISPR RNA-guided endonuclease Cas9 [Balneola sp.]MBO6652212.1 type II CRISPR RNA-guided endonuclease Cas9 [Balneola sp.]MBO6712735.1 type II CRISPR RNA-guided endonuclease Cas9 [Balneola sp.]MBO6801397.1 type II CRISPR RNA-guided endonuclease Cas9 [Balneola sp.]MBO6871908.1 type II CRISPR RNA-guided endonuclease Cas9 [Balneola sp.]
MKKILGLDLGVASIGWGLIETGRNNENGKILKSGVRIFQGNEQRADAAPGESSNADRRTKRSIRRQRDRRTRRKINLYVTLKQRGLAPNKSEWDEWVSINPYTIRAKALDEKVSLHELGRALYHLNQRRGYKSNRKAGSDKEGAVKEGISKVRKQMAKHSARTIGEYFYEIYNNHQQDDVEHDDFDWRIRDKYTHRKMFKEEFNALWEAQTEYHNTLSEKLGEEIKKIIFHQRKMKSQSHLIGKCELETDKKRIAKAHLLFQEFRVLKNINNLSVSDENGLHIKLTDNDRKKFKEIFDRKDKVSWSQLKTALIKSGSISNKNVIFNLERGGRKNIEGNRSNAALSHKKAFADEWFEMDDEFKNHVVDVLIHVDKPEVVKELALIKWNRTEEQAEYITHKLSLEQRYGNFSEKAIKKILPYLEKGTEENTAIKEAGYSLFEQNPGKMNQLPMPDQAIKNPVVYHALIELRKVVNGIIREYGMPDVIRVELARDLKAGYDTRQKMTKQMRELEKKNDKAYKSLQKAPFDVQYPSYNDIIWYNLWEECEKMCPYTGKSIPAEAFNSGEFQIEHILPFSSSLDNSYANKTLCEADFNRKKGNRTPWKCVEAGLMDEDTMLQRIRNLPWNKRNKFTQKEIDEDIFLNRQLNDTRYISKEASSYLKHLSCESVEVVKGQTTSLLRHLWGLNSVLNKEDPEMKNRNDHRHHAVDAIVVAFTNRSTLKRLSDENKRIGTAEWMDADESGRATNEEMKRRLGGRIALSEPWLTFRNDVEASINNITVSHRVNRKVSGALHEETYYGPTVEPAPKNKQMMVVRKPVHQLSKKDLTLIRDATIRKIVNEEVQKRLDKGESQTNAIASLEADPPYIVSSKAKVPIKKVRLLMKKDPQIMHFFENKDGKESRAALYGNNHHIAIYETTDENEEKKQVGIVVPMMEAARRVKDGESVVMKNFRPDHSFLFSLAINDMIFNNEHEEIYRVQKIESSGKITFRHQHVAMKGPADPGVLRKMPSTLEASKIKISPIGEIFPAND